jgi:ABC-type transport system involved in multi-copper enzyme maturation permease subunit
MNNLGAIAVITFLEGLRSRVFFGLFLLALALFSATYALSYLFPRDLVKVAIDLGLGITSLVGLVLTLFLGTQLLAKDLEKRTIHTVLAKAVSRSEYVVGKFAGLSLIIVCAMAILGAFAGLAAWTVDFLTADQYGVMHWPAFVVSLTTMTLMLVVLTSVIFFFTSFASSTFVALGLTLIVYVIGQSIEEIKNFLTSGAEGMAISPAFGTVVSIAYYVFPNLAAFDFKTQAAHGLPLSASSVAWALAYGAVYTAVMVTAAAWIFRRREFP